MAKTKVKIKNIDKVLAKVRKTFKSASESKRLLNDMGDFTVNRNQFFARIGKSLSSNVRPKSLPALKDSTKAIRARIAKEFPEFIDGNFFKSDVSNVTLSGQLLKALRFKIKDSSIILFFKRSRRKIRPDDSSSNDEVYDNLVSLGFDFIGLDEKGQRRIKKLVLDEFRRSIKKNFK